MKTATKVAIAGAVVAGAGLVYLSMGSIVEMADSMIKTSPIGDGTLPQINGINKQWQIGDDLSNFATDIATAKSMGFNNLRTWLKPSMVTDEASIEAFATMLNQTYGNGDLIPILFDQGTLNQMTDAEAQTWIDLWTTYLPNVYAWELYNEPVEDKSGLYDRIVAMAGYLRTKTSAPITIGFAYDRPYTYNDKRLTDICDIVGMHFYPVFSTVFGKSLAGSGGWYSVFRRFPQLMKIAIPYQLSQSGETSYPANDLKKRMDWVATTFNKPFLLSEWGFAVPQDSRLDIVQSRYADALLDVFKHYVDPNFLGHHFYAFREPGLWSSIQTWNRTIRPVAQVFS